MSPSRHQPREGGLTLIELLTAVAISSVLIAAFMTFYLSEQRSLQKGRMEVDTSQALRTALDQITRDLRVAGRNPLEASGCGFLVADAAEVDFTFDADDDGNCDASSPTERKAFRRQGTVLEARVDVGSLADWETLAENLVPTEAVFAYHRFGAGGELEAVTSLPASSADLAEIGRVDVTLSFSRNAPIGGVRRVETASVTVRNRTL